MIFTLVCQGKVISVQKSHAYFVTIHEIWKTVYYSINHHKINGFKIETALNFGKIGSNQGHGKNSISRDQAENISISCLLTPRNITRNIQHILRK